MKDKWKGIVGKFKKGEDKKISLEKVVISENGKKKKTKNLKATKQKISSKDKKINTSKGKVTMKERVKSLANIIKNNKMKTIVGTVTIVLFAVVALIAGQVVKEQNRINGMSAENRRAMNYEQVQEGDEIVENTNGAVEFDAFFLRDLTGDGYAESIRGTSKEIGKEDTLYMELNVQTEGYLKNAKIEINGQNFYLQTALPKDEELKDSYVGNNIKTIEFNDLANGTQKLLTGIVRSGDYSYSSRKADAIGNNINNYSKVNSVTLTGTYVNGAGEEFPITKTVDFNIDWYGTTRASIYSTSQTKNIENAIDEENGVVNLDFTVYTEETNNALILSKNQVEGEIPELNGYAPTSVEYTGSNGVFNYNAETRTFTITRESIVSEDGTVTSEISSSCSYGIKVTYPIDAYYELGTETVTLKIPVRTYYEGYNNINEEFINPYKSNIASATIVANYQKPSGTVARFEVTVGKYISNPSYRYIVSKQKPLNIYNGISESETADEYLVKWYATTGSTGTGNMIMKETKDGETQKTDEFIKTDSSTESMEEVTSFTGIYFSNPENILGEEGEIKVYDEDTGNLLVTFNKDNWNKYSNNNPYQYEIPVKHIRVETSEAKSNQSIYVYNVKTLDDEQIITKYSREQFDQLQYIKSTLTGYIGETYINTDTHQANYEAPLSIADISISKNTLSTQVTEKNAKITIQTQANESYNQVKWQNGTFLVKIPDEILTTEINEVTISNSNVQLKSYELIENENGTFIKINTQNDTPQTYNITIDVDLSPDPRIATTTKQLELYATNEVGSDYYYKTADIYDINGNQNTEEMVNKTSTSISLVSPNSLLTNQTATNFDDKGSMIVSPEVADIKPVYAVVDQVVEEKTVDIGVQIKNNYASTISEIDILGKIPFEGNTYVLSGGDLGSTFTTKMTNTGIQIPAELEQIAKVYYSENETPDKDITKQENGWKTAEQVENWDNIKTFLIDLGDYVMPTGKEFVFNYTVKIPNGLEFNQVSYSHHGVYFCLDTDQGKYKTQTEPNKIGFRIAEKYNLELTKYQTGKDKLVPGATYSITEITTNEGGEETRGESKTAVTNAQGVLTISNLYAEKEYEIQEIKTPDDYELNSEIIRFIGHVDEEGTLTIEKKQGTTKGDIQVEKQEGQDYKVKVQVEDEAKATLKVVKKERGTENLIQGARFKLTGYNLSENGRNLTTNANGEITFSGVSVNQEYTLQEVKAEGYYLANPIKFKIANNDGNYTVEKIEDENATGEIKEQTTTEEDSIPTISVTIEDEKIPTYDLQLIKIKKTTESTVSDDELIAKAETALADTEVEYLEGAKFKLYKGTEEIGEYTTDSTGTVTIPGLYQYVSEKDVDQTYTLKEVLAPAGYAKVKDITFKVQEVDGILVLKEINEYGEENDSTRYTAEGNTIKLTIEDSPSFKLIKKDAETQTTIPNVKFAIYNVDSGEVPATDSKGEIIGTKETINGKEYYTVTTNENGEITADLPEGLYKAVEVQAPEQYDISNSIYYFGIGASREAPTTVSLSFVTGVGEEGDDRITSVVATSDGGYIAGGHFVNSEINIGDYILENQGSEDGMIIKYNREGGVEWARNVGGNSSEYIQSIVETSDGGYIAVGYFESNEIQVGDYTLTNNGSYGSDGMIIKYSSEGTVEWAKSVGGNSSEYIQSIAETSDGGYIVVGYFGSISIQIGDYTLTNNGDWDGIIIKYNAKGEVEWANSVGGGDAEKISSVAVTSDGGAIAGGHFYSSNIQVGDYILTNNSRSINNSDGIIIKYNAKGEVEWAKNIGGEYSEEITSVAETNGGDYIAVGDFYSDEIQVGDYTLNLAEQSFNSDGMIIKYSSNGEVKFASSVGGNDDDEITSVAETNDGGYIVGVYSDSNDIQTENYNITNYYRESVMIIKYDPLNKVEWVKIAGGEGSTHYNGEITSVDETIDGGCVVGGYFLGKEIQVGDYTIINNNSSTSLSDGIIIKYSEKELIDIDITKAEGIGGSNTDEITSVVSTSDGGYIAVGYFESNEIQAGDYTLTNNRSGGLADGMIIKYSSSGEVEWARSVGGNIDDQITSVASTSDGGYVVGGRFESRSIQVGDYTFTNDNGLDDGIIIKYSREGEVEWARSVGGSDFDYIELVAETSDGGVIAGGYFESDSIQVGDYTVTNSGNINSDGLIIKYSREGAVEWVRSVGGNDTERINSIAGTSDGGVIAVGDFSGELQAGNHKLISSGSFDGMLIKYSSEGEVEWIRSVEGNVNERINSIAGTSDGGYIVGGYFTSDEIQVGDYTLTNNGNFDGMIIKYSSNGEVEWARNVGGKSTEIINSIAGTSDGGYIAGGYFISSSIQVGDYTLMNSGIQNGMIIKYSSEGEVEWAKSVGGSSRDEFDSVASTSDGGVIAGGFFSSSSIEEGRFNLENKGSGDGLLVKLQPNTGVPEVQELVVENSRKEFEITTDVQEIDGVKGGTISGEDTNPYETVKYGETSTKEIIMTPDENFEIIGITVNGEEYQFEKEVDGTYTMPPFENMTEDKHVVVTFALKDNKLIINKVDSATKEPLQGAVFKLDQIEERTEPENVIEEIIANGAVYAEADTTNEITDVQGSLTNNGTYYFVENENGGYVPTNSKTYQIANGGSAGIKSSTANSYIPIDLSSKEGKYVVVVNAQVSSENNYDYGYATITNSTTAPVYDNSTERFMYITGTSSSVTTAKDYTSTVLEGRQTYYLHLGYRKDSSGDTGDDQVVINSIKVYKANTSTYNFIGNQGKYESNNQGKDNTTANSYIPIDLIEYTGKYNLTVNANVSSQSSDYGYATVTNSIDAPAYNSSTGRFIYISGEQGSKDYTTILQGGQMYYLHLGYYKNASTSSGEDKFTVNSVELTLNDSELYHTQVTTNSEGQGIVQIPFGKYQITEITAPEGYELNEEPTIIDFRADGENHEITIENSEKAKVIVHHYLKNNNGEYTTTKVTEDEFIEGKGGEKYTTNPKLDLEKYELEKDENGQYVIPENATGTYTSGATEVTYYYEEKEIPLIVHHYIEGTTEKVPLKDGTVAQDVKDSGKEGNNYQTSKIEDSLLSDDYELVKIPENASGTYEGEEVIVTYYYKLAERPLTILKTGENGETLEGVKFTIESKEDKNSAIIGELTQNGEYYFIEQNGKYTPNNQGEHSTTANSYIKIDMTNSEIQKLVINAEISSESGYDYGYATITESTNVPSYNSSTGRIFRISGEEASKDYETTLEGGKVYYLHLGYRKDGSGNSGEDTLTINKITLGNTDIIGSKIYTTNEKGKITTTLKAGEYEIREIETKDDYQLPENPTQTIKITKEQDSYEINIENQKKEGTVVTHYYIEGTKEKVPSNIEGEVIEDAIQTGKIGDIYITEEATNVSERYELKEVEGEINGIIDEEYKEIIYYYGLKETNLTLIKTDDKGNGLPGAVFEITNKENGKINYASTGLNGKVTKEVPIGETVVTEIKAPNGYKLNKEEKTITVELNKDNIVTMQDENINYYNFEINKIDAESKEPLSGVEFELKYTTQYGEEKAEKYVTDENGKITLENLEDEIVYTLKEEHSLKGYIEDTEEKQFVVHYVDGKYEVEILKENLTDIAIEGNTIKANIENKPSLKIVKQDNHGNPIQGVKFTITNEQGQEVTDGFGNPVGEVEEINGEQLKVLTTNKNGVIAENLLPGKYILTEVQTPSKYILPEENERTQTIEITQLGYERTYVEQTEVLPINFENVPNVIDFNVLEKELINIDITADGKIILATGLLGNTTITGENTVTGEDIELNVTGTENAINIIFTPEGKVEKVIKIESEESSASVSTNILSMPNGDYVALGMYMGTIKIPVENTVNGQEITLTSNEGISQFIVVYNEEAKVKILKDISYLGIELNNFSDITLKGINNEITIIYPYSEDTLTIPAEEAEQQQEINVNNEMGYMIANLNEDLKITSIYAMKNTYVKFEQETMEPLSTGENLIGGYNDSGSIIFKGDETATGETIELDNPGDGIIAKYNQEGKVEWAKELGSQAEYGGYNKITEVSDGYIAIAYYQGNIVIPKEETEYGEEIKVEGSEEQEKSVLIKYTEEGKVEWITNIDENMDIDNNTLIKETEEGYSIIDTNNMLVAKYQKIYEQPIAKEQAIVTIQNKLGQGNVIVHHYKENTTESLSADQTITGEIDSAYETQPATDIPVNYELVSMPDNATGTIKEGTTEVIYYYKLKEPSIETPEITKESTTEKITSPDQAIDYNINYTAKVDNYIGNAKVTIVDTLPYEIDTAKSNIANGTYNAEEKTITWTEEIGNIDTFVNGAKEINITKEISLVYKDIDVTQAKVKNTVTGTINLETPQKEEKVEDTKEIPTEYTTQITVNKIWNDNETQVERRPESIIIVVKNGDQEVKTQEITKDNTVEGTTNQWSTTIEGLQKYDENGNEIQYTVEEREKTSGDLKFYEVEENNVAVEDKQATIRNNFKTPEDTINVTVRKIWNDNNDTNAKRPESIKIQLLANGEFSKEQTIDEEISENDDPNIWQYTFRNLAKYDENGQEIQYTVQEQEVNTDDLKFYETTEITGDMVNGYEITNTFTVPNETIELTVNKEWRDNTTQAQRRPATIVINVKAENADNNNPEAVIDTYELNTQTETSHTFTRLPKYNSQGNEIEYKVEETEKNPDDLKFYKTTIGTLANVEENKKKVTIINTFERPEDLTEITVTKVWNDNNNEAQKRPDSIILKLKNGNTEVKEQKVNVSNVNVVTGEQEEAIIEQINSNVTGSGTELVKAEEVEVWQYTFADVDKYNENGEEIVYTVDETEVNSNDLEFYTKEQRGTTVINTFTQDTTKVNVPVTKIWEDNEIQAQRRPESVIIVLKANGEEKQRYELSKTTAETVNENTWTYTFKDLPKYDEYNNIINYTVEEQEKTTGDLKFYTSKIEGTTITNTFTKPTDKISIEVNKKWEDQEDKYEKRPVSIRLQVKTTETVVQSAVVTKEQNWTYTFTKLDKYDENGQEIVYTVDEQEVMENDLYYYGKEVGEVTNKAGETDIKEAEITNTMNKTPSTVVVKYVDKNTGKEISDEKVKEGIIGDPFDVTEDVKEIPGYTLVEEPEEKTGTYTSEVQEKIYYYAKNTKVTVKYLEQDETPNDIADNKVLAEEKTMLGYEGESYSTFAEDIEGYTLVETTDNTSGVMQREEIVVIYYYAPNTNVVVKYLEKDNTPEDNTDNKVLEPERTIEGYVGKEYKTIKDDIPGYTFIESTENTEGTMTKDPIEVIYYYAQNTKVIVKYLEKDDTPEDNTDNQVLAKEEVIEGYEGKEYETEQKSIKNYTFAESTNNTKGNMTKETIEVIYYYAQNTKAKVQHIDRETGEILKEETKNGKVGDIFETQAEDFEGYVLVESPEEPNIVMDKTGEQVVKYYYAHISAGVIEKHIDDITGELLYSEEHKGNEGDYYNIPSKTFEGYDLVTEDSEGNSKLPTNAEGKMKKDEVIEVKYYYSKKAKVIVKYLEQDDTPEDLTDNLVLEDEEIIEGHENDNYETEEKDIKGYNLVETPENATGKMEITKNPDGTYNTEIIVVYYYKKQAGRVIENHIDINTNKKLAVEEHEGNVGDEYNIPAREFEGYDLVTEDEEGNNMLPTNSKGQMTEKVIEVNYYYEKQAKVKVEYIDKQTGNKLDEDEIQGHVGDSYETEEKEFEGYDLIEKPSNSKGKMEEEEIIVKYYYERKAEVEVKYLEKGTDYEVSPTETIEGHVGDKYETEQKEIPYYKFVEKTENYKGEMEKQKITVIYYYEKQLFNLSVDKWVENVNVNGISQGAQSITTKDQLYKVDIHRSKTETADIKITYKIRITNKGEIEGTAGEIVEVIPAGYSYSQEDNNIYWENKNGTLITDTLKDEMIQPGEYKEIEIVLRWIKGESNFGQKDNLVILSNLNNPAGYEDVNKEDNSSSSSMLLTIATGLDRNDRIVIIGVVQIVLAISIGLLFSYKKKDKNI